MNQLPRYILVDRKRKSERHSCRSPGGDLISLRMPVTCRRYDHRNLP